MEQAPKLDEVVTILRAHEDFFRAKGVTRLSVCGSVARGEARPDSDVDLVIEYDEEKPFSLLTLCGLQNLSSDWLGHPVDMLTWNGIKPRMVDRVRQDAADVF
jgi:predicted nucleotidyltransferase